MHILWLMVWCSRLKNKSYSTFKFEIFLRTFRTKTIEKKLKAIRMDEANFVTRKWKEKQREETFGAPVIAVASDAVQSRIHIFFGHLNSSCHRWFEQPHNTWNILCTSLFKLISFEFVKLSRLTYSSSVWTKCNRIKVLFSAWTVCTTPVCCKFVFCGLGQDEKFMIYS